MTRVMEQKDDVGRPGDDLIGDSAGLLALRQAVATQSVARDGEAPRKAPEPFEATGLKRKRLLVGASVAAAIGSSLCCIIPIVAAVTGIGTIATGAAFEAWRPYLLGINGLLLGAGFLLAYRDYQRACIPGSLCATKPMSRWSFSALGVVAIAVVGLAAFPYYSGVVAQVVLGQPSASYSTSSVPLSTVINQSISSFTSFLTRGIRHDSLRHEAR
jgi:hypothetical protein